MKTSKKITENTNIIESPVELQNNITFWVVQRPKSHMDMPDKISFETDPVGFANQVRGGLLPQDVLGFYSTEEEASNASTDVLTNMYETASGLEKKKETVSSKIQKKIDKLQREVNAHLKATKDDPTNAESHQDKAEQLLAKIKDLRSKHKMVEGSKKEVKPREEVKKSK